ncbi:MAG: DNA mismatch repair endonuclease MutL [Acidobacteria bacterium]|nr:DNA mismatch repair endonuclease MutL [Acidobacteriota bacterium]
MSKIRVLSDHVANQIAAGEVVERPASVAKELVENSVDAGARRVEVEVEAGGRRLLRVSDDGEGMTRDDAVLAFERHATSKINSVEDLERVSTLGFRGEALASIASVARVELLTQREGETEGTRVVIEGGRMRDVAPAARPKGTTIAVRDLFFNVPARRKFLRSEATESFHLTNLVTHYALAHPEISFVLTNNGREVLRGAAAENLRERAYQIFGDEFIESLLAVAGGSEAVGRVSGFVSAPRARRTTRDAQYLFVNGRFVRDRLVARALTEGYRTVLPHGVYPSALLFLEVPPEEVDVNVHPAKTEVRFRRASAVAEAVREAVRAALYAGGYLRDDASFAVDANGNEFAPDNFREVEPSNPNVAAYAPTLAILSDTVSNVRLDAAEPSARQESIEFGWTPAPAEPAESSRRREASDEWRRPSPSALDAVAHGADESAAALYQEGQEDEVRPRPLHQERGEECAVTLPPLNSAAGIVRGVAPEQLTPDIRPLGQLEESYILATDAEGLLLIDQHAAHERVLFDKYRRLEAARRPESQSLLVPETFDLTPAQAAAFEELSEELEGIGFSLTRLSGRTVAVRAVPADLQPAEARNLLAEILDTVDSEKRGRARETLRDEVAASLACHAAIKVNMPLTHEKMRWLIDRLLLTASPTTCPHGRPAILRLAKRDIERGFHRP